MNQYQEFIHKSRYARWLPDKKRRETWEETVDRYVQFFVEKFPVLKENSTDEKIRKAILNLEVMPSMRCLMTAGPALDRDNIAGYNCGYLSISRTRAFDELMYILLCGTGVGFSVESKYVNQLPIIEEEFHDTTTTIHVRDSKVGWAKSVRELISLLYAGQVPEWDVSKVRPSGARLKVFGGRASGPEPLVRLFTRLVEIFKKAAGRRLTSLECHDICCYIADAVVVGGVRRAALISLSDLEDSKMAGAKSGDWYSLEPQRANANNSVAYANKPDMGTFMQEWSNLYESKSGERGIFNRQAALNQALKSGRREVYGDYGTNPCSEIILRDRQFCNLTEVVVRPTDIISDIRAKIEVATILGTAQSALTDFSYITPKWKENCEEERLLGVSLTGIMDCDLMWDYWEDIYPHKSDLEERLEAFKKHAIKVNAKWADKLGINRSTAITCVKPSGTVSQLVGCSSGIHPAQFEFYYRTVRQANSDPLTKFLIDQGVKHEPARSRESDTVFYFPMKSADGARINVPALDQLRLWKVYQDYWCEHKPSCTVYVGEEEWMDVGAWVYENFDDMSGVSFFPRADHIYEQAPYIELTQYDYVEAARAMPIIKWDEFDSRYETDDNTTSSQELACVGNVCEVV